MKKGHVDPGFKTGYGSKEPSGREESAHISNMAKRVGQKPDTIGPCGGHMGAKMPGMRKPNTKGY